ncbi:hypothetical protein E2C01_070660 [Portunus trituberculatus]|uniref:Uncharacterized protein n=1 Tax=Portunus trituberculatus TaxID=210409 RepID=A0A5B7I616_PORTR|nr:hypothetical protein [Portunus trituberculatus]
MPRDWTNGAMQVEGRDYEEVRGMNGPHLRDERYKSTRHTPDIWDENVTNGEIERVMRWTTTRRERRGKIMRVF